jgi:hypothetical protein
MPTVVLARRQPEPVVENGIIPVLEVKTSD